MSRRTEPQQPEKPFKNRYLESKEMARNEPKKLRLTDLCPQEKLKVGELIKLNETRKLKISELTQELEQIREKFSECQGKLLVLEQRYEEKERACHQLRDQLESLEEKTMELEVRNRQLALEQQEYKELEGRMNSIGRENRGIQTESHGKAELGMQTKRVKTKNREIQAEEDEILENRERQIAHSRSFDRILKGKDRSLKNSLHNQSLKSHNTSNKNQEEENEEYLEEMEVEQRLNELAKQWLDLKEKKVSNLKAQYQHSKAHLTKQDLQTHPKEFTFEDNPPHSHHQLPNKDIDDNELNNLLKSNNFSASRLLTSKGILNQSQNSRKASVQEKSGRQKNLNRNNAETVNLSIKQPKLTLCQIAKNTAKTPAFEKPQPTRSNFYESDFMDLVDSLNQ